MKNDRIPTNNRTNSNSKYLCLFCNYSADKKSHLIDHLVRYIKMVPIYNK